MRAAIDEQRYGLVLFLAKQHLELWEARLARQEHKQAAFHLDEHFGLVEDIARRHKPELWSKVNPLDSRGMDK